MKDSLRIRKLYENFESTRLLYMATGKQASVADPSVIQALQRKLTLLKTRLQASCPASEPSSPLFAQLQLLQQRVNNLGRRPSAKPKQRRRGLSNVSSNFRKVRPRTDSTKTRKTNSISATASKRTFKCPVGQSLERAICNGEQYIASLETKYRNVLALAGREDCDLPFLTGKLARLSAQIHEHTDCLIALKRQQLL